MVDVGVGRGFNCGDFHTRHSLVSDTDFLRGAERKVETAAEHKRTAIVDAHSYRAAVLWILDFHDRAQRQSDGRRGKSTGIEGFTTGSRPTSKFVSIPGCCDFMDRRLRGLGRSIDDRHR